MNQKAIEAAKEIGYVLKTYIGPGDNWMRWELYDPANARVANVSGRYDGQDTEKEGFECTLPAIVADALVAWCSTYRPDGNSDCIVCGGEGCTTALDGLSMQSCYCTPTPDDADQEVAQ